MLNGELFDYDFYDYETPEEDKRIAELEEAYRKYPDLSKEVENALDDLNEELSLHHTYRIHHITLEDLNDCFEIRNTFCDKVVDDYIHNHRKKVLEALMDCIYFNNKELLPSSYYDLNYQPVIDIYLRYSWNRMALEHAEEKHARGGR